jgi:hypothetical protein
MSSDDITPTNVNIGTNPIVPITTSLVVVAAADDRHDSGNDNGNKEDYDATEFKNGDHNDDNEHNQNSENHQSNENENDENDDAGYATDRSSASHHEPDHSKVSSLPYGNFFCRRLEKLWHNKREKQAFKRWREEERLEYIIPRHMIDSLHGQTMYPHLRLLLPDQDSSRQFHMREKKIAETYCRAQGFVKGTRNYDMLMGFTDPQKVPPNIAGDLSQVIEYVLAKRMPVDVHSKMTLGKMNEFLDEVANLKAVGMVGNSTGGGGGGGGMGNRAHHNHEWRSGLASQGSPIQANNDKSRANNMTKKTDSTLRSDWLRRVMKWNLSPLEHKWMVRILLRKMDISLGYVTILKWYTPYATELWYVAALLSLRQF